MPDFGPATAARVCSPGPNSPAFSLDKLSARRLRALLTRDVMAPRRSCVVQLAVDGRFS